MLKQLEKEAPEGKGQKLPRSLSKQKKDAKKAEKKKEAKKEKKDELNSSEFI